MKTSEHIDQIITALAKAQGAFPEAVKDSVNPHFKSRYADLASIWRACRDGLSKNGLAVVQAAMIDSGDVLVETRLAHTSGQWIESSLALKPAQMTPQSIGSAISYGRRYALSAMIGVTADDDDGNSATTPTAPMPPAGQKPQKPTIEKSSEVSEAQLKRLFTLIHEAKWTNDQFRELLKHETGLESTKDLKAIAYESICNFFGMMPSYEQWKAEKL